VSVWPRRAVLALAARGAAAAACSLAAGCRTSSVARRAGPDARATAPADDAFSELRGACDGVTAPDAAEWAEHRTRVQANLRAAAIDALVVEPGAGMAYLSGIGWGRSERPFVLVLPAEGDPVIVCPSFEERTATERASGLELVLWREHEDPAVALAEVVRRRAGAKPRLAIEPSTRRFVTTGLARALAGTVLVDDDVLGAARIRKTDVELARLRRANEATKRALAAVAARIRVGTPQDQIGAWTEAALVAAGMVEPWALALVGPNASFPHGTSQRRAVEPGDVVLIDTGASLHGYRSDITRTFVVGRVDQDVERAWTTVARAQQAAFDAIAPGVRCGAVDAAARAVMDESGFGRDDRWFTHRLGHGIGLEVHEAPYLVGKSEVVLAPGMTMSNEPGVYVPGAFGVRLEDIVVVTEQGADVFGPWPGDLQALPG
jgi:Xaa-Pro dipeptidase